jgi:hypothetical protein
MTIELPVLWQIYQAIKAEGSNGDAANGDYSAVAPAIAPGALLDELVGLISAHAADEPWCQDFLAQHGIVQKALVEEEINAEVTKSMMIQKSWSDGDGRTLIEGWISTEAQDLQKDIAPPEAFLGAVDGYMALGAPLTSEHQTKNYPVGHMQRVAMVRNGQILKAGTHPVDPADFEYFPASGTGVYGRGVIDDPIASAQVAKGNVRGFSWIGMVRTAVKLPGGGLRFTKIEPWRESTITAFPVNQAARLTGVTHV